MGLFDKLGAGGGTVTLDVPPGVYPAGGTVRGTITFTGGKRAQTITALQVWLTRGSGSGTRDGDGGSAPLGDKLTVAAQLSPQPGQVMTYAFELPVPTAVMNSRSFDVNGQAGPVMQMYRVWGTADIPGEIDKHGQSAEFEITGGAKLEITVK
jgi:hypothetical protein